MRSSKYRSVARLADHVGVLLSRLQRDHPVGGDRTQFDRSAAQRADEELLQRDHFVRGSRPWPSLGRHASEEGERRCCSYRRSEADACRAIGEIVSALHPPTFRVPDVLSGTTREYTNPIGCCQLNGVPRKDSSQLHFTKTVRVTNKLFFPLSVRNQASVQPNLNVFSLKYTPTIFSSWIVKTCVVHYVWIWIRNVLVNIFEIIAYLFRLTCHRLRGW